MARKKKPAAEEYSFLGIQVREYSARVDAYMNHEARDPRRQHDKARIYSFDSALEIEGACTYPEERTDHVYRISVHGQPADERDLDSRLGDYHVRGDDGLPKYRKVRGREIPLYDLPNGLGLIQKERGATSWYGWLWVPEQTVTQILTLLTTVRPLYISLHERRVARTHWIAGFALQTTDPAEE